LNPLKNESSLLELFELSFLLFNKNPLLIPKEVEGEGDERGDWVLTVSLGVAGESVCVCAVFTLLIFAANKGDGCCDCGCELWVVFSFVFCAVEGEGSVVVVVVAVVVVVVISSVCVELSEYDKGVSCCLTPLSSILFLRAFSSSGSSSGSSSRQFGHVGLFFNHSLMPSS